MKWIGSDGTVVELGGKATGDGPLAQAVRMEFATHETHPLSVMLQAPDISAVLDLYNPEHVDRLVRSCAMPLGIKVDSPAFERSPKPPRPNLPPDCVQ